MQKNSTEHYRVQHLPIRLLLLCVTALLFAAPAPGRSATTTTISLDTSAWQIFSPWGGTASMTSASDGITFRGSGYRQGTQAISTAQFNLQEATLYCKWMVHGPASSGGYGAFGVGAGLLEQYGDSAIYAKVGAGWTWPRYGTGYTTHHSWTSSLVLGDDTWYYSRITIAANGTAASARLPRPATMTIREAPFFTQPPTP